MKTFVFCLVISLTSLSSSFAQKANGIVGNWLTQNKNSVITISENNGKYFGRITWLEQTIDPRSGKPFLDGLNPDKSKRDNPIINLLVLKNFVYNSSDQQWKNGTLYNATTGKTYQGYMELESKNRLKLRGYIGLSFFGQTVYWTRLKG